MKKYLIIALSVLLGAMPLHAQEEAVTTLLTPREEALSDKMLEYIDEYNNLVRTGIQKLRINETTLKSESYLRILNQKTSLTESMLQSLDFRWNAFSQAEQADIATSEYLMDLMTRVQTLSQSVADTLASQKQKCEAIVAFAGAKRFILAQDSVYQNLYKEAEALSLVPQLAPQLEKVKAEEQTLFKKIDELYSQAAPARQLVPQLADCANVLDAHYFALKAVSTKIQGLQYKPPLERAKDYLMGLACVAVILLFVNSLVSKLQSAKKARETLKKQKEMLERTNGTDYPTI